MKKKTALCLVVCILVLCMQGCTYKTAKGEKDAEESQIKIGICFDSFVIERWIRDRDTFVNTAKELGAQVNVQNANGDVNEQISQIKYLISQKVDVIVIVAVDCEKLGDVIEEAQSDGIKIISYDRLIQKADVDLYMSFDNTMVGDDMASAMKDALPKGGDIFEINGSTGDNNVTMVEEGFRDSLEDSKINIVYSAYCEKWSAEEAGTYVEEALNKYPNVDGIMCGNDDLASEVSQVLSENRLSGKVVLIGQDADLLACQRIVEGTQEMTVFKKVEDLANAAACFAVELAKGEDITSATVTDGYFTQDTINDGKSDVPYYALDPVKVTKKNLDKIIIDSGFHTKEDVYLNVK